LVSNSLVLQSVLYAVHVPSASDQLHAGTAAVWQAVCHSASVHSRAPTVAHAAAACTGVTFVHGRRPDSEHTRWVWVPIAVAVPSG
jgi:hypothetical protein